jgi:DNA-directed RNA polymerase alpha subunit
MDDETLTESGICRRTANMLNRSGIFTVGDVRRAGYEKMSAIKGIGAGMLDEIERVIGVEKSERTREAQKEGEIPGGKKGGSP